MHLAASRTPYVSVEKYADSVLQMFMMHWRMPPPGALLSFTTGASDFALRRSFEVPLHFGLASAARQMRAWLVTSGLNTGVPRLIGGMLRHGDFRWSPAAALDEVRTIVEEEEEESDQSMATGMADSSGARLSRVGIRASPYTHSPTHARVRAQMVPGNWSLCPNGPGPKWSPGPWGILHGEHPIGNLHGALPVWEIAHGNSPWGISHGDPP